MKRQTCFYLLLLLAILLTACSGQTPPQDVDDVPAESVTSNSNQQPAEDSSLISNENISPQEDKSSTSDTEIPSLSVTPNESDNESESGQASLPVITPSEGESMSEQKPTNEEPGTSVLPPSEIETIPDPVFAQKTIGDGISINPSSYILNAPCAGEISNIHSSRHALTIRTEQGIDILMHIGLDTVLLRGEGFDLKVKVGQTVKKGDPLIVFDPAVIKGHSKSLLTTTSKTSNLSSRLSSLSTNKLKSTYLPLSYIQTNT